MEKNSCTFYTEVIKKLSFANRSGGRIGLQNVFYSMVACGEIGSEESTILERVVLKEKLDEGMRNGNRVFGEFSNAEIDTLAARCFELEKTNTLLR